jgi:maltose-binding protein MalE
MDIRSRKSPQRRELSKTMSNPNLSLKRNRSREQLQKNKDNKLSKELAEQTRLKKRIEMMQTPEQMPQGPG